MSYKIVFISLFGILTVSSGYHVKATGRIMCHGQVVPYAQIKLMDNDFIDSTMGSAVTNELGYFTVSGSASDIHRRPDVLIRMEYKHFSTKANFHVTLPTRMGREKSRTLYDREGDVDFGTLLFNTETCRTYLSFYQATLDFYNRVGYRVPFQVKINTEVLLHGGTPYALYDEINIPKLTNIDVSTAMHELAHTVRHRYDGSKAHFFYDVVRYFYPQRHSCTKKTNDGFAFNEGWAEFWESACRLSSATGATDVEGNVAARLRRIQNSCGTSNRNMWEVLRRYPGSIHSVTSFENIHKQLFSCS